MASKSGGNGATKPAKSAPTATAVATPAAKAKAIKATAATFALLAVPARLAILEFVAGATAWVTMAEIAKGCGLAAGDATLHVNLLKQRVLLASERIPKGAGGPGWRYTATMLGDEMHEKVKAFGG